MSILFGADPNVQKVVHYHRIRMMSAIILIGLGYLTGWLASCDAYRQSAIQAACGPPLEFTLPRPPK